MVHKLSSHLLVALQFAAIALSAAPLAGRSGPGAALALCIAGAVIGFWTVFHNRPGNFNIYPEIKDGARLVTTGPYRWIRHPMYLSLLLLMLGIGLYNGQWINYLGLALLWTALIGKMTREENYLLNAFPAYADYATRTHRILPLVY